jgi:hypothetical protein
VHSASQQIPRLLWTSKLITVFIAAGQGFLSQARWIQSTPSIPFSPRPISVLYYPTIYGYVFRIVSQQPNFVGIYLPHTTCPTDLILLVNVLTIFRKQHSFTRCLAPSAPFSNTLHFVFTEMFAVKCSYSRTPTGAPFCPLRILA